MTRPNILHILSDQHSPKVAGCSGDPVVNTPNLDALATSGAVLTNAYCPSPLCVPSRMSMLTGLHPYQNQVWTNEHILDSGLPTFVHALGAAGYRTALIGRMHSRGPDQLRGYSERHVGDHGPNHDGASNVDRGILQGTQGPQRISLERSGAGQSAYELHDQDAAAAAADWLRRNSDVRTSQDQPFLLSVGLMLPHHPFVARPEDFGRYDGKVPPPKVREPFDDTLHPYFRWWREKTEIKTVTDAEIQRARAGYWALVDRLDQLIGQILTALHDSGLADNTMIIYSTDHGELAGEHDLWWKHTFYEESARVPAIISWPGAIPASQRCERVASALDVTATITDAACAPPLPGTPGRSLLPVLREPGANPVWEDQAFSEFCTDSGWITRMIRRGPWKLNYYHGHQPQLFHLANDPYETTDLADEPRYRDVRTELEARVLDDWDPDRIAATMGRVRERNDVLQAWANQTEPHDQYRWNLRPEMNRLD